jgi:hypothetical protein
VLKDGVRTLPEFARWLETHPTGELCGWQP